MTDHPKKTQPPPLPPLLLQQQCPTSAVIKHCDNSEDCDTWWDFFKIIDTDQDGYIPVEDMKLAVPKNHEFFNINVGEIERMNRIIHKCDRNGDAMIDFPEFCEIMYTAKKQPFKRLIIAMGNAVTRKSKQAKTTSDLQERSPIPLFIILISILEVSTYFYFALGSDDGIAADRPPPINNGLDVAPGHKWDIWRYFTYVLLHNGYMHLLINVIVQLPVGMSLELVHNGFRIAAIYFLGAFTGGLLFYVFDPTMYLVGASGGVYALITAHLADVFLNWSEMPFRWMRLVLFGVWVIADFGFAIYSRYSIEKKSKVAVMGHLGGAIAGLFLGVVILKNHIEEDYERIVWWISLVVYIIFILLCVFCIAIDIKVKSDD